MLRNLSSQQRITLVVILILLIAIPLVLFLVRQQQNLSGRAAVDSRLTFVTAGGNPLPNPPTTNSRDITLRIDHGGNNSVTPPPPIGPNPPPPAGNPALNATVSGFFPNSATVTISWTGVNATDHYWYIKDSTMNHYAYLGTCNMSPQLPNSQVRPTGTCSMYPPTQGVRTYQLYHSATGAVVPGSGDILMATSNPVTVQ
jgi:hypothetical protein